MDRNHYKRRAKWFGILWVVMYGIASIVSQIYTPFDASPIGDLPSGSLAANLFTLPVVIQVITILVFFYPLLFIIRYNAKQAAMKKLSTISLVGIILISMWLVMYICFSIVAMIQLN